MANFVQSFTPEGGAEFLMPPTNSSSASGIVEAIHEATVYAYHKVAQERGVDPAIIPSLGGACFDTADAMAESPALIGIDARTKTFHSFWVDHGLLIYMNNGVKELADPTWKQFAPSASNSAPDVLFGTPKDVIAQAKEYNLPEYVVQFYATAGGLGREVFQIYPANDADKDAQQPYAKAT